jgi:tetratricopeptide (TPR) repeat protein
MRRMALILVPLVASACAGAGSGAAPVTTRAVVPAALPFIEDDYAKALEEARSSHRLLFVDAWAPWCHTCLSMKAYTFRDPKVRGRAGDVVWASIDTEKPANAAWVAAHPMHSWPTLFFVEPGAGGNEKAVLEWPNSATPDELVRLIDLAEAGSRHEGALGDADAKANAGTALAADGKRDEAIAAWKSALATAPAGWPSRAPTLTALLDGLFAKKEYGECVETADRELPKTERGGAAAETLDLMCVAALPPGEARRPALDRAVERARTMAADDAEPMLPDDRSGLYESMIDALASDGRSTEAKAVAKQWAAFLEGEAARAPDPAARFVFDAHRVDAYVALGTPELAVPMLQASEHDFPNDYNPPARLARTYFVMKNYDDALKAIDRALTRVYGPRVLRLASLKADILEAKGDRPGAAVALKDGIARARTAELPASSKRLLDELARREGALEASH